MRALIVVLLAVSLASCTSLLLGGASSPESGVSTDDRSSAEQAADKAISATVRQKLGADPAVSRYAIGISTKGGQVTLTGTVGSFAARDRAVQIAGGTEGVTGVRNRISVNTNY